MSIIRQRSIENHVLWHVLLCLHLAIVLCEYTVYALYSFYVRVSVLFDSIYLYIYAEYIVLIIIIMHHVTEYVQYTL